MYCALALGIKPKHFILATLFDTKHSVLPLYVLSSLFDSRERERKVVDSSKGHCRVLFASLCFITSALLPFPFPVT